MSKAIVAAALLVAAVAAAQPAGPGLHNLAVELPDVGRVTLGLSIPRGYDPQTPVPLVVVLHPGGERVPLYGSVFTERVVEPALRDLRAIMIAPDCPAGSWSDPKAENAVMQLVDATIAQYKIDRQRILVTGFSMGGRGTWHMASRHGDVFTAAIPMAASTGDLPLDSLAKIPTYVIHSRNDEVVPFAPAEKAARELERLGRPIRFEAVSGLTHYEMVSYADYLRRAGRWVADRWKEPRR